MTRTAIFWLTYLLVLALPVMAEPLQITFSNKSLNAQEEHCLLRAAWYMQAFHQRLGYTTTPSIAVRLFADPAQYEAYARPSHPNFETLPRGFYSPTLNEVVLARWPDYQTIFVHEMQHALLGSFWKRPPIWANEGLSEHFSDLRLADSGPLTINPSPKRLARLAKLIEAGADQRRLAWLFAQKSWGHENKTRSEAYLWAWAVVHTWLASPNGEYRFSQLVELLMQGMESGKAVEQTYPGGQARLWLDIVEFSRP